MIEGQEQSFDGIVPSIKLPKKLEFAGKYKYVIVFELIFYENVL
jgi:hypothetical protein